MAGDWPTTTLESVCSKIGSGATPRGGKDSYQESGISLVRSQNVYNHGFSRSGLAFISDKQADELSNVALEQGDVLINITGESVCRCCQVPDSVLPARVNQHVMIVRPNRETLDPTFLRYYVISGPVQAHLEGLSSAGATRRALTKSMVETLEVPLPPLPEQRAIASILGALDDKIELNRRMNATLSTLRDTLLPKLLSGELPVPAALTATEEALAHG